MTTQTVDNVKQKNADAAGDVFEAVHRVTHLFRSRQYQAVGSGSHELTHLEGKTLGFFAWKPGSTLSDLASHASRDKGQLARLVATLKEKGLLKAEADEKDRRNVRLHLTAKGRSVHQSLQRQRAKLAKAAIAGFSTGEERALVELLNRVRANLESL